MRKNDIEFINEWLKSTDYIGYELDHINRTEDHVIMHFTGTKRQDCTASVIQAKLPYLGIGSLKITEYVNGEYMGHETH